MASLEGWSFTIKLHPRSVERVLAQFGLRNQTTKFIDVEIFFVASWGDQ